MRGATKQQRNKAIPSDVREEIKRSTKNDCRDKRDHLVNKSRVGCTMASRNMLLKPSIFTNVHMNERKAIKRSHQKENKYHVNFFLRFP